jgi:prolyl-tRNA synthetase
MILAETGEDEILFTEDEQYAANVEKAVSLPVDAVPSPFTSFETLETPDTNTIARLCEVLKCDPTQVVKNVLYEALLDNGKRVLVLISIRGDRDVNEVKLFNAITQRAPNYGGSKVLALKVPDAAAQAAWAAKPLPLGYIAPDLSDDHIATAKDTAPQFLRLVDPSASQLQNFVTGANQPGYHVVGANWGTQYKLPEVVELDVARPGDRAVHDPSQILQSARGIEAGHIFQLGLKYSQAMGAAFTTESGESQPFWMGCYGVGVSRIAQAAVEQSHDKNGIIWPVAIAPYQAIVTVPNIADENQMAIAQQLYSDLNAAGIETILDDREERAGVKFKDADLIGIPFRVVTGRAIAQGKVELVTRATGTAEEVAIAELVSTLQTKIAEAL